MRATSLASPPPVLPTRFHSASSRRGRFAPREITYERGHVPESFIRVVSDGYLEAAGIRLVAGRAFTADDRLNTEPVAVVNQSLARTLWPGQDPIGQMVTQDGGRRVVGIVGDVRHENVESPSGGEMYLPMRQYGASPFQLVVRTTLPTESLANASAALSAKWIRQLPIGQFTMLETFVDKVVSPRRFLAMLLAGFAGFALLLASLGHLRADFVFGEPASARNRNSHGAGSQRRRRALEHSHSHAQPSAAAGLVLGLVVSRILTAAIASLLYGVDARRSAHIRRHERHYSSRRRRRGIRARRRASRIDPIQALRADSRRLAAFFDRRHGCR